MNLPIGPIDHVAYPVHDLSATIAFLTRVLGASAEREPWRIDGEIAGQQIRVGSSLLSLHRTANGIELAAPDARPGCLDICFRWHAPVETAINHLAGLGIAIVEGPVPRQLATGQAGQSVYFRDPDNNLIELLASDDGPSAAG